MSGLLNTQAFGAILLLVLTGIGFYFLDRWAKRS